uniref:Uncharacterized protein MANES_01G028200 n=1 Tax=Rhizophora mucronata TaxID=61149 RepID=A0A2P2M0H7_RHIMU
MLTLTAVPALMPAKCIAQGRPKVMASNFPAFLPKEVEKIKDPFARKLATRIERLSVRANNCSFLISVSCSLEMDCYAILVYIFKLRR